MRINLRTIDYLYGYNLNMNKILLFLLALTFSISGFAQSICELEKERGIIEGMSGIYHPTQAFGPSYSGIPITSISTYSVEDTIVTQVDRVKIEDEYYYKNYISEWNKKTKEMSSSWKCWYEGYKTGKKTSMLEMHKLYTNNILPQKLLFQIAYDILY